jgi:hypothetical protein
MDTETWGAYNELLRVIKFDIDTKTFGLKFNQDLTIILDGTRRYFVTAIGQARVSVTGFIIYLLNVPICWRSKSQKEVTLSSTEAKYVAISENFKELKFIY